MEISTLDLVRGIYAHCYLHNKKFDMRLFSLYFTICLFLSCNTSDEDSNSTADKAQKKVVAQHIPKCDSTLIADDTFSFEHSEFMFNALERDMTCEQIKAAFSDISTINRLSQNKYSKKDVDTTATFKVDCDLVTFISSKQNCFPLHMNIQSQRITLSDGKVRVGMSQDEFRAIFKLKGASPDVIRITDLENANELIFVFSNHRLMRIVYNNIYYE